MKKIILALCMLTGSIAFAQVGIGTATPDPSSVLDLQSTTQGLLAPRMTTLERTTIDAPAESLLVFDTDLKGFYFYNASTTSWKKLANGTPGGGYPVRAIGESYGGGIVFYVYDGGQHGLIAATADQSTGIRWHGGSDTNTRARADGIGAGLKNTAIIIANQGPVDGNAFAATVCNEYSVTVDGVTYGDWYLPSKYELNLLYKKKNVVGGFASEYYWSSYEYASPQAWVQNFGSGVPFGLGKFNTYSVRAVRAF